PRPSNTNPGLPGGFDMVVARGMAKNPYERFDTALELGRAARNALTTPVAVPQQPVRTRPATPNRIGAPVRAEARSPWPSPPQQHVPAAATIQHPLPPDNAAQRPPESTRPPSRPWWGR